MAETQKKTLQDYLEEGGIKGKFFKHIGGNPAREIYQVIGFDRNYRTEPRLVIQVAYPAGEPNNNEDFFLLMTHLYDFEATPEELKRARRSGLASALVKKAQTRELNGKMPGLAREFSIDPCQI